jgi:hypothetical protein
MRKTKLPKWLLELNIVGHEDDDPFERAEDGSIVEEDGAQVLKDGWELGDDGKPKKVDPEDDEGDEEEDDDKEELKAALAKERKLRKKAEREARVAARKKTESKEAKDLEQTQAELTETKAKTERLAAGLLNREIDTAIEKEAQKQGFIDPSDALTDEIRRAVREDADQDPEDPSDIEIDSDSVTTAVKALARKKKHLLGTSPAADVVLPSKSTDKRAKGAPTMGARYDQVEPHVGIVRAPLAAALTFDANGECGPLAVSIDSNGRCVVGTTGQSGFAGVLVKNVPMVPAGRFTAGQIVNNWMGGRAGDVVDIMIQGQIVDVPGLAAGITVYAVPATGVLTATVGVNVRVGFTVEAGRLVVDGK